ncbi:MAG: hypothetical protein SV186_00700 [Candidatus Nanohaloarchaea archaeon]|nr:hypothetical protein [Candidatus Nanohaloarchaea archaeon]
MAAIRECNGCGKKTDFWTEIVGKTAESDQMQKKWRIILCQRCAERETVESAMEHADEHVTQHCQNEGKA